MMPMHQIRGQWDHVRHVCACAGDTSYCFTSDRLVGGAGLLPNWHQNRWSKLVAWSTVLWPINMQTSSTLAR